MRVVFMGTPEFAVPSLRALCAAHEVVAVYTQPDRVRRRGKELVPTPVRTVAEESGIPVYTPRTLRDETEIAALEKLRPDIICVAAYGMILPPEVLAIPPYGCVNVHASILPRHRGAAPIHRAILDGDELAGVSIMRMEEGLDTGPYATLASVPVDGLDVEALTAAIAEIGAEALLETLAAIEAGTVAWTEQDDSSATYAPKVTDADLALSPDLSLQTALRRVRASTDSARSKLVMGGRTLDVLRAVPAAADLSPGLARCIRGSLLIGFSDGVMSAEEVRPEGRGVMSGAAFAAGARIGEPVEWGPA